MPYLRFSTLNLPTKKQHVAWQTFLGNTLNSNQALESADSSGFPVDIAGYDLGKIIFGRINIGAEDFARGSKQIQADGEDGWLLAYRLSGNFISKSGDRTINASAGDLEIRSMSIPHEGTATQGESIYLYLSGDAFGDMADILDPVSHTLINGTMGDMLKDFMLHMDEIGPHLDVDYAKVVSRTAKALIKSCVASAPLKTHETSDALAGSILSGARRYIASNLSRMDLDTNTIAEEMNVSRRQLYNVFQKYGGIAAYIRRRRLLQCHDAICDITDSRQIQTIAYEAGFSDATQFSRLFRAEFGYAPSEAPQAEANNQASRIIKPSHARSWFNL